MYLYILKSKDGSRFKIGKANDIHQRLYGIGGQDAFDLAGSVCVKLDCERQAYTVERALHKLFDRWRLSVVPNERFPGDTEYFDIACFARVNAFLQANKDLTSGEELAPIPDAPSKC